MSHTYHQKSLVFNHPIYVSCNNLRLVILENVHYYFLPGLTWIAEGGKFTIFQLILFLEHKKQGHLLFLRFFLWGVCVWGAWAGSICDINNAKKVLLQLTPPPNPASLMPLLLALLFALTLSYSACLISHPMRETILELPYPLLSRIRLWLMFPLDQILRVESPTRPLNPLIQNQFGLKCSVTSSIF